VPDYYCIIHMPGAPCRDIVGVGSADDAQACQETERLAAHWPGFETIALYDGERPVAVLANPQLGFAAEPLDLPNLAA
jgi:hypothetical protein